MKEELNLKNAENFSLKEFFKDKGQNIEKRLEEFDVWTSDREGSADILYCRKILSPMDREVIVEDPYTNQHVPMLMFGSNNYLGLATHNSVKEGIMTAMKELGYGVGGPPLLNGYNTLIKNLEESIANFKETEEALITASGYMANLTWINALVTDIDAVFFDEYNHSSFFYGISSTKAKKVPFRHNDLEDLRRKIEHYKVTGDRYLMIEGVYSMDGDLCDLPAIMKLVEEFNLKLIIDDAHGTGVIGPNGGGVTNHFGVKEGVFLHVGTFSKAISSIGGFLAGDHKLIHYLRFMGGQYMFSASAPPHLIGGVQAALNTLKEDQTLRQKLRGNVEYLIEELSKMGINTSSESAIVPILLPKKKMAKNINIGLHKRGCFVNSVEYPAVPEDKERLRISVCANHTQSDLDRLVSALVEEFREKGML